MLIDGTPLAPSSIIQPGTDVFFYRRPAPETPVPYEIDVVYEDADIMVVDKPPFLATMPRAAHITETATVRLRRATGNEELTPAHRLDRMTSGLLLLTKRREIRGAYQELFAAREVHKRYVAVAEWAQLCVPTTWRSHIDKQHGEIASTVIENAEPNAETIVRSVERLAPERETEFQRVHGVGVPLGAYLLEPVTGRTHQLRVHMCDAGFPILGDPVYPVVRGFGDEDFSVPMRLKSVELAFIDPLSGAERKFRSATRY
ncbi:pseudouridine synthase [Corynebacterium sp. CNCTC7651]|uniref:pseudouridine synthase n=1 Tax=Corynebacterium sp. CNCTC7651 TaxID=2815361 RepID=UPI00351D3A63